jgi:hypothetical protein
MQAEAVVDKLAHLQEETEEEETVKAAEELELVKLELLIKVVAEEELFHFLETTLEETADQVLLY